MPLLINHAQLDRFSSKPALLHRLIQIYMDISVKLIGDIETGALNGDTEQVGLQAHSLKGSSSELGAEELAELSHQLQMAARTGDTASIGPLIKDLIRCYKETIAALQVLDPG